MTSNDFHAILKQYWGYDAFRPLQEEIIASVCNGKDTLGLMPTGGGKSITFQVPTLAMEGICLVVTPLIALMKDQVDGLRQRGIRATMIHSGMGRSEIETALENCIFGDYKFLYVSPERLSSELFITRLRDMNVCLIAVDESHCISQWGYDFRPSYLRIADLREWLPGVPVLALTATATLEVIEDIQDKLRFGERNVFRKSFERKNIAYVIRITSDPMFEVERILRHVPGSGIVYVRSRNNTEKIAQELQRHGLSADFFHAGLTAKEKMIRQNSWKSGECRVIVCTNAFGMGIDKPDVRFVVHYELPDSLEAYFQEAGRAGRDERKAYAVALYSAVDGGRLKRMVKNEYPEKEFILDVYEKLAYFFEIGMGMGAGTGHDFVIERFCTAYHYNRTQVRSALRILDLAGYIKCLEEADKQSRLMFIVSRDDLYRVRGLDVWQENLMQHLLRSCTGLFSDYVYINELALAEQTGMTEHEVYEGLKMLSAQRIIHYIPARKVPTIYYLCHREERRRLIIPKMVYEDRRKRFEERVAAVIRYGSSSDICRSRMLLHYFGEADTAACGHCDVCLSEKKKQRQKRERFLADNQ
jgi:ATP-dependent DNA helicase RecQ